VKGWNVTIQSVQNHNNRFPLLGAHAAVDCDSCHKNAAVSKFATMPTDCYSCHAADFKRTTNPNHVAGGFSPSCEQCHGFDSWLNAKFDHSLTGFPLTGAHVSVPCIQCHVNNNYNLTAANTACVSCHLPDFQKASNPNHVAGNFSQNCQQCHNTSAWSPASFDHNSVGFPLTGGHANLQCSQCHINNNYNLTSTACVNCHLPDYQKTTNPNHAQTGIPQTCEMCHNINGWSPASFDHNSVGFPLTNAHAVPPRQCVDCHINSNYSLNSTACISCHQSDYNTATSPVNHISANFPTTCQNCHDTVQWTDGKFDHTSTGFALTGLHTVPPRACTDCHVNNNYSITTAACVSCHLTDFNNTTNPNHVTANFPQACDQCHSTSTWLNATFNHNATGFALTGSHMVPPRQCTDCHVNNNYNITNTACVSCHQQDYNTALSPVNHVAANFPTTCETCHDTVLWTDGKFDHSTTGFALTGLHTVPPRACTDCHVNNNYSLSSAACVTCHQSDYNTTNNPPHGQAGFPTTCQMCHDTVNWMNATFNHASTGWALTGFHTTVPCGQCHVNNNYGLTSANTACSYCHMADWSGTTNPVHSATGWPTTCNTCHNTTAWIPANLPLQYHTMWNPNHGGANGVCATCHTNPNDFSVFTCTNCHQKAQTDSNHRGVNGYVYNSVNCYNCHKNGGGGGG
jgi:hypothetical protein